MTNYVIESLSDNAEPLLDCSSVSSGRHARASRRKRGAIGGPIIHEPPPLVERVAAPIGPLHLVIDRVR
jgi:hypothetical protein